jgi:hypothetical protein
MRQIWALFALMVLPAASWAQTRVLAEVCADPPHQKSCISAQGALSLALSVALDKLRQKSSWVRIRPQAWSTFSACP